MIRSYNYVYNFIYVFNFAIFILFYYIHTYTHIHTSNIHPVHTSNQKGTMLGTWQENSLPLPVLRFLCKTFSKLLKFALRNTPRRR